MTDKSSEIAVETTAKKINEEMPPAYEEVIKPRSDSIWSRKKKEKKDEKEGEEKEAEEKEDTSKYPKVSFFRILSYAGEGRGLFYTLGSIGALVNGGALPLFSIVLGQIFNAFFEPPDQIRKDVANYALIFVGLGVGTFLMSLTQVFVFTTLGEKITANIRSAYFRALLRQEIGFFDKTNTGKITSRMSGDIVIIQNGSSEKLGLTIYFGSQLIVALIIAFYYGWKLTLVLIAVSPLLAMAGSIHAKMMISGTQKGQDVYADAGQIAEEVIGGSRTVKSFTNEEKEMSRYESQLTKVFSFGHTKARVSGFGFGSSQFIVFGVYALGFWYGGTLVADNEMTVGAVLTTFFSVVLGAMGLGQAMQLSPDLAKAKGAASAVFYVIDKVPEISENDAGVKLETVKGDIELKDITFCYPTRPDIKAHDHFNLKIKSGETVALCGPSGGGKSTVIALLEIFYTPESGQILVDGHDIKSFNLKWYRQQLALVSQEPILFATSIADNIRYGKENATDDEIIEAAKTANAHDFIIKLTDGYKTQCGEKGLQMSGGQKQRIAIARAVLKNPQILLLDEATSALDAESEALVQDALEKIMKGRTSIVIAHRLSTIQKADKIVVIDKGKVLEEGSHNDLLSAGGVYQNLIQRQLNGGHIEEKEKEKEEEKEEEKEKN